MPLLRFHCIGGCWDRIQDCWDFGINWQPDAQTTRLDLIHTRPDLIIILGSWWFIWNPLRRCGSIRYLDVGMLLLPFPALVGCCLLHPGSCCRPPHPGIAYGRAVTRDHNNRKSSVSGFDRDPNHDPAQNLKKNNSISCIGKAFFTQQLT